MKGLPGGSCIWTEYEREEMWIESQTISCNMYLVSISDAVSEYFIVSSNFDKNALCGCKIERLVVHRSTICVDAREGSKGRDATDVGLFVEECLKDSDRLVVSRRIYYDI